MQQGVDNLELALLLWRHDARSINEYAPNEVTANVNDEEKFGRGNVLHRRAQSAFLKWKNSAITTICTAVVAVLKSTFLVFIIMNIDIMYIDQVKYNFYDLFLLIPTW